jgi:hypothetical protein
MHAREDQAGPLGVTTLMGDKDEEWAHSNVGRRSLGLVVVVMQ